MANKLKPKEADQGKRLSTHPSEDPDRLPPKFCLRGMRPGFSVQDCTKEEKAQFADRLYRLSRMTWAELRQAPRKGLGWEIIQRSSLKRDAVPLSLTDDAQIIAFRCIGDAPMVGYRSKDGVFNILWIDRAFDLYKH